jgi:CspA family cold shock protein
MATGKVKFFNTEKGYGFIEPDNDDDSDVFVHVSEVQNSGMNYLLADQRVSFDLARGRDGRSKAVNLRLL